LFTKIFQQLRLNPVLECPQQKAEPNVEHKPLRSHPQGSVGAAAIELPNDVCILRLGGIRYMGRHRPIALRGLRPVSSESLGILQRKPMTVINVNVRHDEPKKEAQGAYAGDTMIYKFKSKATGDLIMLQAHGQTLLKIIGKSDAEQLQRGILLPEDMPRAILALQQAVSDEEQARSELAQQATAQGQTPPPAPTVSLRQRSLPFIQMAQRCMAEKKEIVWGV